MDDLVAERRGRADEYDDILSLLLAAEAETGEFDGYRADGTVWRVGAAAD